ncbi:hypothetical protein ACOMHN_011160 [Nucella lapillus]
MEQLNSMFTRLKQGLYAGGDCSQPPKKQQSFTSSTNSNTPADGALEDEGFVLINRNELAHEAMSDRMAVHSLPPYSMTRGQNAENSGRDFAMFATCDHLTTDCPSATSTPDQSQGIIDHPAVAGVPFQINPKLQEKDRLQSMLSQLDLENSRFDWQKYSYDFNFEQSSLRELCAMDKTRMADSRGGSYNL